MSLFSKMTIKIYDYFAGFEDMLDIPLSSCRLVITH